MQNFYHRDDIHILFSFVQLMAENFQRNCFTKRSQPAKLMLGEASSPFCIPAAGQC